MEMLRENRFDVVFIQLTPDLEHKSLLRQISDLEMSVPVIAIARDPSVTEAVSVMQAGAVAYIEPPLTANSITSALDKAAVARESVSGQAGLHHSHASGTKRGYAKIIGKSKAISHVFTLIKKLCDTDTTVLIQGESGTGKELIAQALHYEGERRKGPFVSVNCGAIPEELLESELFGHEKGAFTHAIRTRIGRFELAHGGTVFLDEIAEMSPMLQVKILRVLQDHQFERIGSTKTITSDFRVIAATNRELEQEVKKGNFREDLYYRLNVFPITVPPLRERFDDITLLASAFAEQFAQKIGRMVNPLAEACINRLKSYDWPGNVRE
ncbi:MAG: sigma-54-dependent Fis family transcriptional regulator, partial [Desulfobulbaceae bacterium]|nr:sigma-54-dependent Fis family transcriptional regulator [Desulfobulbaceae bacterium]